MVGPLTEFDTSGAQTFTDLWKWAMDDLPGGEDMVAFVLNFTHGMVHESNCRQ